VYHLIDPTYQYISLRRDHIFGTGIEIDNVDELNATGADVKVGDESSWKQEEFDRLKANLQEHLHDILDRSVKQNRFV